MPAGQGHARDCPEWTRSAEGPADFNQEGERASGKAAEASKRSVERGGGASVCHGDLDLSGVRL